MRGPRRGIIIRLLIYVPVISFLGWRVAGGCSDDRAAEPPAKPSLPAELAPHRKVITLPDGTQQEIVELTREEAEQILGHPIPEPEKAEAAAEADAKTGADAKAPMPEPAPAD